MFNLKVKHQSSVLYCSFASVYGCPLIWSSSVEPHAMVLSLIDEAPNTAYMADSLSPAGSVPPFNFIQRVETLWQYANVLFYKW